MLCLPRRRFVLLMLFTSLVANAQNLLNPSFDEQHPNNISEKKWSSLKMAMNEAKLLPTDGAERDSFGYAVSLFGDRALIGAFEDDDNASGSGSAYIFDLVGGSWQQTAKLTADDGAFGNSFGYSVSLYGDRALVGALSDDNDTGVNSNSGSAYIFDLSSGVWSQTAKLIADDRAVGSIFLEGDRFGTSVSLFVDRALVGAFGDDDETGSAYVFDLSSGVWSQTSKLTAIDRAVEDGFGISVSLSGNRALIGANGNDDNGQNSGSAYIFDLTGGTWSQTSKLNASSGVLFGDRFGTSVSLDGDRALIGAYLDDDNFPNNNNSGSAYIFEFSGTSWLQRVKLTASDSSVQAWFGYSVSLLANRALVGAYGDNSQTGSAYIFEFSNNSWSQISKHTADDGVTNDRFGYSVSLSGGNILVGAYQDDDSGFNSGSSYVVGQSSTFIVGGVVSGLASGNTVEIENNLIDTMVVGNGAFAFATELADLSAYSVTVSALPTTPNQTCVVTGGTNNDGTGTVDASDVTDIIIVCTTVKYNIGVTVAGLITGNSVVLQNNFTDDLMVSVNDVVNNFSTALDDGSTYAITVLTQPDGQNCDVSNASGSLDGSDVSSALVNCSGLILEIDNNSLDFGSVSFGASGSQTITMSNGATADIVITGFTDPGPPFFIVGGSCNNLPITLMASESCQLTVQLNANDAGSFTSSFDIISNALSSPDLINLQGFVQAAVIQVIPIMNNYGLLLLVLIILVVGGYRWRFKLK